MTKKSGLAEMLSNLSKEELLQIILRIAEEDDRIEAQLIVKYGSGKVAHQLQARKKLIKIHLSK